MTWVQIPGGERDFFLPNVQTGSETQPTYFYWIPTPVSLGVERPKREADYSPLSSAEVEDEWSCTSTLPSCINGVRRDVTYLTL